MVLEYIVQNQIFHGLLFSNTLLISITIISAHSLSWTGVNSKSEMCIISSFSSCVSALPELVTATSSWRSSCFPLDFVHTKSCILMAARLRLSRSCVIIDSMLTNDTDYIKATYYSDLAASYSGYYSDYRFTIFAYEIKHFQGYVSGCDIATSIL